MTKTYDYDWARAKELSEAHRAKVAELRAALTAAAAINDDLKDIEAMAEAEFPGYPDRTWPVRGGLPEAMHWPQLYRPAPNVDGGGHLARWLKLADPYLR